MKTRPIPCVPGGTSQPLLATRTDANRFWILLYQGTPKLLSVENTLRRSRRLRTSLRLLPLLLLTTTAAGILPTDTAAGILPANAGAAATRAAIPPSTSDAGYPYNRCCCCECAAPPSAVRKQPSLIYEQELIQLHLRAFVFGTVSQDDPYLRRCQICRL
jgi:hypothetical protein